MRLFVISGALIGLVIGPAIAGGPTATVTATAGTSTTASANSMNGGTSIVTSFGLAGTTTSAGGSTATTTSFDATQVRGFAVGPASFAGTSQAHAMSSGWSSWSH